MTRERTIPAGEILIGDAVEIMNCPFVSVADQISDNVESKMLN